MKTPLVALCAAMLATTANANTLVDHVNGMQHVDGQGRTLLPGLRGS